MSGFFDIHTHVLPRADDGSSSSNESIEMLCALFGQGVGRVVASPHFYASSDEPGEFLKRRGASMDRLLERIEEESLKDESLRQRLPDIYLGGEVEFFGAMSNVNVLSDICISGTKRLLVEMPFAPWKPSMLEELYMLRIKQGITPIIAHVDRYFGFFKIDMLYDLLDNGVEIQMNADAFLRFGTRRRALELLKMGMVQYLGSDTHNMGKRAPRIGEAIGEIEKRLGREAIEMILYNGNRLAKEATPLFSSGDK